MIEQLNRALVQRRDNAADDINRLDEDLPGEDQERAAEKAGLMALWRTFGLSKFETVDTF